jgi:hypothetical protein
MADEHRGTTDDPSNFIAAATLLGKIKKEKVKKQKILDVLAALMVDVLSDLNNVHDRSLTIFEFAESNNAQKNLIGSAGPSRRHRKPEGKPELSSDLKNAESNNPENNLIESAGPSRRHRKPEGKLELSNELKTGILDSLNGLYERSFNSFESSIQMIQSFELFEEDEPLSPCISAVSADEDEDEPSQRDVQAMIDELRTTCGEWEQIHLDGVAIPGTNVLLHTCGATRHVSYSLLVCTTRFIHFSEAVHAVMPKRCTLLTKKGTGISG